MNPVALGQKEDPYSLGIRVLTDDEIRSVWQVPIVPYDFTHSASDPDNVKKICRSEINENVWTIPSKKFKLKKIHIVAALVPTAIKTLARVTKEGGRSVFHSP